MERPARRRRRSDALLASTPLSHVAGLCTDVSLLQGGGFVRGPAFDAGTPLAAIARDSVTHLRPLQPLLHRLADHPPLPTTDDSGGKHVTYGGSPASELPGSARPRRRGPRPVPHRWYGRSETLGLTEVRLEEHLLTDRHGRITMGRPLPEVELVVRAPPSCLSLSATGARSTPAPPE
ncbi:AMP-binding protein [Streptomyces roseolus]|uniref:AMP-binding protein n=1 Tax=Streptomyces roseolus TaxID=67358 RepID=UPI0037A6ACC0